MRRDRAVHIRPGRLVLYVRICDFFLVVAAGQVAWLLSRAAAPAGAGDTFAVAGLAASWLTVLCLDRVGAYEMPRLRALRGWIGRVSAAVLPGAASVALYAMVAQGRTQTGWHPAPLWGLMAACFLLLSRSVWIALVGHWIRTGRLKYRIGVVGATEMGVRFAGCIRAAPDGYERVIGLFDDAPPVGTSRCADAVAGSLADLLARSRAGAVDAIVLALPLAPAEHIQRVLRHLRSAVVDVYVLPDIPYVDQPDKLFATVGGHPVIPIIPCALDEWQALQKAAFDRVFGLLALALTSPLLLLVAALIKLDSPGPVLFRQPRIGFNNRPFRLYKFRSLYHHLSDVHADRQTSRDDPRVTRVGRWLRKLSLDELPQLLNVVRGEMSLVGPRPHAPNTSVGGRRLEDVVSDYAVRHRVKPGITGWAQVNGARGALQVPEQLHRRVEFDLQYIREWSLLLDVKILALTLAREIVSSRAF